MAKKRIRDRRKKLVCFECKKKILHDQRVFYFPIDRPVYVNAPIHVECRDFEKNCETIRNDEEAWKIIESYL